MRGLKLRTVVGLFLLVLCGAGVLVAHVWKQNAYVRMSIAGVKLVRQRAQLRNDIALLEISVGSLKKLSRLEGLAKGRFGLEYGNTPVLIYLDKERGANAAPGTVTALRGAESMELAPASAAVKEPAEGPSLSAMGAEVKGLITEKMAWLIKGL